MIRDSRIDPPGPTSPSATSAHMQNEDLVVLIPKTYSVPGDATFNHNAVSRTLPSDKC